MLFFYFGNFLWESVVHESTEMCELFVFGGNGDYGHGGINVKKGRLRTLQINVLAGINFNTIRGSHKGVEVRGIGENIIYAPIDTVTQEPGKIALEIELEGKSSNAEVKFQLPNTPQVKLTGKRTENVTYINRPVGNDEDYLAAPAYRIEVDGQVIYPPEDVV